MIDIFKLHAGLGRRLWGTTLLIGLPVLAIAATPIETSICEIQANPGQYEGKEVSIKGRVVAGMEATNVRDLSCPDEMFVLNVGDDFAERRDLKSFMKGIRIHGRRADATLIGSYSAKVPGWPYPLPGLYLHAVNRVVYDPN